MQDHKSKPLNPAVRQLIRKLECWELEHLRQLSADQAEQLEHARAEIELLRSHLATAEDSASHWHGLSMDLLNELHETTPETAIGITSANEIGIVNTAERKAA